MERPIISSAVEDIREMAGSKVKPLKKFEVVDIVFQTFQTLLFKKKFKTYLQ